MGKSPRTSPTEDKREATRRSAEPTEAIRDSHIVLAMAGYAGKEKRARDE